MEYKENIIIERKIGNNESVKIQLTNEEMFKAYDIQRYNYMLEDVTDILKYNDYYNSLNDDDKKHDMINYVLDYYLETGHEYNHWYDCIDYGIYEYECNNKIEEEYKPAFTIMI